MKIKLIFFLIISYSCFSQERKKVTSDVFLIKNYIVDNYKQPDSVHFSILVNEEYSKFGDRLLMKLTKHAKKANLTLSFMAHTFKLFSEIDNIQKTYRQRYVALIFFGNKHDVLAHKSGDPKRRRILYDIHYVLYDNHEEEILFKKKFDVFSTYYVRNENSLAKAIVSELMNTE